MRKIFVVEMKDDADAGWSPIECFAMEKPAEMLQQLLAGDGRAVRLVVYVPQEVAA